MVIKLTVSQTSGYFLNIRAGGVHFYFWSVLLMNMINRFGTQIEHLQKNECKVATQITKYTRIYQYMLRRKGWSLAKTFLRGPFSVAPLQWVVSQHQPHERERLAPRDYSMSSRPVPLRDSFVAGPTVTNNGTREAFNYYHLPSLVPVQIAIRCLIAGPVRRPICNDDDELEYIQTRLAWW